MRTITVFIAAGAIAAYGQALKTKDISPDQSDFTFSGAATPGGRIMSLVVDPNHDNILYAAGEFGGIWKSTSGVLAGAAPNVKWSQANKDLRNGITANQYSLAVDASNSNRILYATSDDDGRPLNKYGAHPYGGLWVSLDAAGSCGQHRKLCPVSQDDGVASVAFSTGRAFVTTVCGMFTSASSTLDLWEAVTSLPATPRMLAVNGGNKTLFACDGNQVYRTQNWGASWTTITISANCNALTAGPNGSSPSTQVLVMRENGSISTEEVTIVDFTAFTATDLGFSAVAGSGSGLPAIAATGNKSQPVLGPAPGVNYDLYAADGCAWYEYSPSETHWIGVAKTGPECTSGTTSIHADTWAMTFPSWYDATVGRCAAYAATDGGVFFSKGASGKHLTGGGCATAPWTPVQTGLHALEATVVTAITRGATRYSKESTLRLALFLPTGDNDVFVQDVAQCPTGTSTKPCTFPATKWQNLNALGDAGQALFDPAFPDQSLVARNEIYVTVTDPPSLGGAQTSVVNDNANIPPLPSGAIFLNGYQGTGTGGLLQVMTTPAELSTTQTHADYIALIDYDWHNCSSSLAQTVVRNTSNPTSPSVWNDLSPLDHFISCDIAKMQAAGGHGSGLNVYVLTGFNPKATYTFGRGPGKIYRGVVTGGQIPFWSPAAGPSDSPFNQLGPSNNFYVNPFDPTELYSVDVTDGIIQVSRDSGNTWANDQQLLDIATNHQEYRIDCNGSRGGGANLAGIGVRGIPSSPFANGCSIAWIAFDVFHPEIRVVGAAYGGIGFSRDHGHHWMALDVTNTNHFVNNRLTKRVSGVAFDAETPLPGLASGDQVIYAGLKGQSLMRVEGPFLTLEALNFAYTPTTSPITSIVVNISTTGQSVRLRKDPDGVYRGAALFDSSVHKTLHYDLVVDGVVFTNKTYTLTSTDIANGVATAPL